MIENESVYRIDGIVCGHNISGFYGVPFIDRYNYSLIEMFAFFHGRKLNVRIWFAPESVGWDGLDMALMQELYGGVKAEQKVIHIKYSEYTQYDDYVSDLKIGGHDLAQILLRNVGKYVYIEIRSNQKNARFDKMW